MAVAGCGNRNSANSNAEANNNRMKLLLYCPDLLRFRPADVGATGGDFTFHRLFDVRAGCASWNIEHRVQSIYLEDVVVIRMSGRWRRSHILRTAEAVLIGAGRYRAAFGNHRGVAGNIPDHPVRDVVIQAA